MRRVFPIAIIAVLWLTLFAGTASAHVTVSPAETTQGSYEVFTVRVPTEKESATTKVEVLFPDSVSISRVQPQAGWSYRFDTNADGNHTAIVWMTEGEGLKDGEFGEFKLQGKVSDDAKELVWKAFQTYADGSVVEWIGGAEADTPASVTKVLPGTGSDGHHASGAGHVLASSSPNSGYEGWLSSSAFYVALAALAAGVVALSLTLRRRKGIA
ncbi:YcnI family copper-binding membrane protein [Paenibacillus sp. YIM B09110]|uniref:YcnI family copper-binding membrane protein n=1 Tax=Paenibacillus sp. YIM B09110 TaxID=3126102 RepID=UPI00301C6DD6